MNLEGLLSRKGKERAIVRQRQSLGSDFGDDYIVDDGYQAEDSVTPMVAGGSRSFDDQDSDDDL